MTEIPQAQLPQANYYQPGYPVLAFLYALYCDGKPDREVAPPAIDVAATTNSFSYLEFKIWRDSGAVHENPIEDYRGYLDSYVSGERAFPAEAETLSAIEVPRRGSSRTVRLEGENFDSTRYVPALETALKMVPHVIRELTNEPSEEGRSRVPLNRATTARHAQLSAAAPLLSTLAVMFLKGDRSVWQNYAGEKGFSDGVVDVLRKFSRNEPVSSGEASVLGAPLAKELSSDPAVW